jgi:hypothetical protein
MKVFVAKSRINPLRSSSPSREIPESFQVADGTAEDGSKK